jgi:tetratricopeptide (TPR) repeat protein
MIRFRLPGRSPLLAGLALLCGLTAAAAADGASGEVASERIAEAYQKGRCAQVVALAQQLDSRAPDSVDGITHYRWGFCAARTRRGDPVAHYEKAAELLGEAVATGEAGLQQHFYRVNALINLRRADQAVSAAREAVDHWESGRLTVDEDSPAAWFRLGKLYRDAGRGEGALEPFGRALDLAEDGQPLRDAYLERIARGAREAGDTGLASRASALLGQEVPDQPAEALRMARTRLAAGDLAGARKAFEAARKASGSVGMTAQYALRTLRRAEELERHGAEPVTTLADGTRLARLPLSDLQRELSETARRAFEVIAEPTVERARRRGPGTRPAVAPETRERMRDIQPKFAGLLLEALRRGAPLRAWAVQSGYGPLIHHRWGKLNRRHDWQARQKALLESTLESGGAGGGGD